MHWDFLGPTQFPCTQQVWKRTSQLKIALLGTVTRSVQRSCPIGKKKGVGMSASPLLLICMYQSELGQAGVLKQYIIESAPASPPLFPPLAYQQNELRFWGSRGGGISTDMVRLGLVVMGYKMFDVSKFQQTLTNV